MSEVTPNPWCYEALAKQPDPERREFEIIHPLRNKGGGVAVYEVARFSVPATSQGKEDARLILNARLPYEYARDLLLSQMEGSLANETEKQNRLDDLKMVVRSIGGDL